MNHKYTNSERVGDVNVESLSKDDIIYILYHQLRKSNKVIKDIKQLVNSSHGVKDITDYNGEILNPLYTTFKDDA